MSTEMTTGQAAELTAKEREAWGKRAHKIETRIKRGIAKGREAMWDTARALYEFDQDQGWLGLGYENKSQWLADPEIGLTQRTYQRMVRAHKELSVIRKLELPELAGLDMSKVDIVLPKIEEGDVPLRKALDDVRTLGANDLRTTYYGERAGRQNGAQAAPAASDGPPEGEPDQRPVHFDEHATRADQMDDVVEVEAVQSVPPSLEEWEDMQARAKRRRQNFVKYAAQTGGWFLLDGRDGSELEHWSLTAPVPGAVTADAGREPGPVSATTEPDHDDATEPAGGEDVDAMIAEVQSAIASGASHPRVPVEALRLLLQPWLAHRGQASE